MSTITIGKYGEKIAKTYLQKNLYDIIDSHWQKITGEIDIIAKDPQTKELVFIEVKTTSSVAFGWPEEKVDKRKIRKITTTAKMYLRANKKYEQIPWRIDVISIIMNSAKNEAEVTHFKNITSDL